MKFTTVYLDENKIEVFNSIIGQETIKVNGEIVSQQYSILGAEHNFTVTENGTISNCKLKMGLGLNGVVFDLFKNNKPVVESPKSGYLTLLVLLFLVGIAASFIIYLALN